MGASGTPSGPAGQTVAFVYTTEIDEHARWRGLGRQAMLLLEEGGAHSGVAGDRPERLRRQRARALAVPLARLRRGLRLDVEGARLKQARGLEELEQRIHIARDRPPRRVAAREPEYVPVTGIAAGDPDAAARAG